MMTKHPYQAVLTNGVNDKKQSYQHIPINGVYDGKTAMSNFSNK